MTKYLTQLSLIALLCSCASRENAESEALYRFAEVNCLFWYFEKKGYESNGIRAISAGIVENSDISLDKFQSIALFVKEYAPDLATKSDIDPDLNKCFELYKSPEIKRLIEE